MENIYVKPLKREVSRIGLGTWAIGGTMWGGTNESDSIKTILTAIEKGINLIDTAPVYGFGVSEKIIGQAINKFGDREQLILATKAGLDWRDGKIFRNTEPKRIQQELQESLERLQTDYIDIYQIHWPDPRVSIEEVAHVMKELYDTGKIKAIGVSNFSVSQLESFKKIAPLHISQPPYNLFEREIEQSILPFTEKYQIITLAYGALCRGLLSGRMQLDTQFHGDDLRKHDPKFKEPCYAAYLNAVSELNQYAQHEFGKTVLALAVRWLLDRGHIIALWGARHPHQLDALDDVFGWNLDNEAMINIDSILAKHISQEVNCSFMAPHARTIKI